MNALQCEWRIKCPSGRPGLRDAAWKGPAGRVRGLGHVLGLEKWTGQTQIPCGSFPLHVWVEERYAGDLVAEGMLPTYVDVNVVSTFTSDVRGLQTAYRGFAEGKSDVLADICSSDSADVDVADVQTSDVEC